MIMKKWYNPNHNHGHNKEPWDSSEKDIYNDKYGYTWKLIH